MTANALFELFGLFFQLAILGAVLAVVGWQVRKFFVRRSESRQYARAREVAALVSASKARQRQRVL